MVLGIDIDKELYNQAEELFTALEIQIMETVNGLDYPDMLEVAENVLGSKHENVKAYRRVLRALDVAD